MALMASTGGPAHWSVPDWVTIVGLPLTIIGLILGWLQIRGAEKASKEAKTASEAARDATEDVQRQLADNHLLLLVPRLKQASRDLENAVDRGNHAAARTHLADWRELAVQVRALVVPTAIAPDLVQRVNVAVALIPPAEDALHNHDSDAFAGTRHVRERIRDAVDDADAIITERMAFAVRNKDTQ